MREATLRQFMRRYKVDMAQAERVGGSRRASTRA